MAGGDLDVVIRSIAKKQLKTLTDAAKKRHGRLMGMAAKAKDKEAKDRYKHIAKNTLLLAGAAYLMRPKSQTMFPTRRTHGKEGWHQFHRKHPLAQS